MSSLYMVLKAIGIYAVARVLKASHAEALERAVLMAQGGEFAFVLYAAATSVGLIDGQSNAILTAIVIISMVLTPFAMMALKRFGPVASRCRCEGVELAGRPAAAVCSSSASAVSAKSRRNRCCCAGSMCRSSTTMSR
jgi:glutathione-regulated potassium-efflux system protein KefB